MLRKALNLLIVVPLAIVFVIFAVANRHLVTVSFDPFDASSLTLTLPLFIVILLAAISGVIAGGAVIWIRQRHWRRMARKYEADAARAERDKAYADAARYAPVHPAAMINPPV